jgi:hypothetical protein
LVASLESTQLGGGGIHIRELSDALAGTPISGLWELRSPLSAEEQSNPSLRPKELKVLATLRCRK